jgi:hypothetical protein
MHSVTKVVLPVSKFAAYVISNMRLYRLKTGIIFQAVWPGTTEEVECAVFWKTDVPYENMLNPQTKKLTRDAMRKSYLLVINLKNTEVDHLKFGFSVGCEEEACSDAGLLALFDRVCQVIDGKRNQKYLQLSQQVPPNADDSALPPAVAGSISE